MVQHTRSWNWRLGLAGFLVIGGAIALSGNCTLAQNITLDGTLGQPGTLTGPFYIIPQAVGQTVGNNLFHSFGKFNLDRGEVADFESAANIRNILSRVTGGSPSSINGLIVTDSYNVNLFLINPSGIQFGPNARLDVGGTARGSFIATTVDALVWPNGSQFSATNPSGANSLLTIVGDPSGFLASQRTPQTIVSRGSTLKVYEGQSLILLGGDITLDGSFLYVDYSKGGRIELGGVAQAGTVGLGVNGNELRLSFPDSVARADVSILNGTNVNVEADNGGSLAINDRNLNISGGSILLAGIGQGLGKVGSQAGNIDINATGIVEVAASRIRNTVQPGAVGNSGNINITARSVLVTNRAGLSASTWGQGDAGSVTINATDSVVFDRRGAAFSQVNPGAVGNSGGINITTRSLSATNGGGLSAGTLGQGNAGSVNINATNSAFFDGVGSDGGSSGAFSRVLSEAVGNGGNVNITTRSLSVTNGAQLDTSTLGQGNAGSVNINASDSVLFDGTIGSQAVSAALSRVESGAVGQGGNVNITTRSLSVTNGGQLITNTRGQGDAGNVNINATDTVSFDGVGPGGFESSAISQVNSGAVGNGGNVNIATRSLFVTNGAGIGAGTAGQGSAGNITIKANDSVILDGVGNTQEASRVSSAVDLEAVGNGGNIDITTHSLSVTNGARLLSYTEGQGNAGSMRITADSVTFDGVGSNGLSSAAISQVQAGAVGNGGNLDITTRQLFVTNGAGLSASTSGRGNAGNILVQQADSVLLSNNSLILSTVSSRAQGQGGDIDLQTKVLSLSNEAQISAETFGTGNAGRVFVRDADIVSLLGSAILTESSGIGSAGDIIINTKRLRLLEDSRISASNILSQSGDIKLQGMDTLQVDNSTISALTRTGHAGNVSIEAANSVQLSGQGGLSVEATQGGTAGNLTVTTGQMSVRDGAQVTVSSPQGQAGNLTITANSLALNQGTISAETAKSGSEDGANIALQGLDLLRMDNESLISASALGNANGGNVTIDSTLIVATPPTGPEGSDIIANAFQGNGGRVNITTQGLFGIQFRPQRTPKNDITVSSTFGLSGEFALNTPGVDPSRGLAELPSNVVHAEELIDRHCTPNQSSDRRSSFTVTGRGGLPPSPNEPLRNEEVITNWVTLPSEEENQDAATNNQPTKSTNQPLVEAQGWAINEQGQVVLTAKTTTVTPQTSWLPSPSCPNSQTGTQ